MAFNVVIFVETGLFSLYLNGEKMFLMTLQKHRSVGVGRDLCGSSSPTPLPKQGHLEQGA